MAIDQCAPCTDSCYLSAAANSQGSFFSAALVILCSIEAAITESAGGGAGDSIAHDSPATGNPSLIGGYASAAVPTAVDADGDLTHLWADTHGRLIVAPKSATSAVTSVAGAAASTSLLAANSARLGGTIANDSTADLYLLLNSGTASNTNYSVKLRQDDFYEIPFGYTGAIKGIWASATGSARITEFS